MQQIHVTLASTSAFIMDKMVVNGTALGPEKGANTRRKEMDLPRQQACPKVYLSQDGHLMIPGTNLWSCLVSAGKFQKIGRSKLTTRDGSILPGILELEEEEVELRDPDTGAILDDDAWEVDSRPITNQVTKGKTIAHRPRIDNWKADVTLWYDPDEMSEGMVRQLVDDAGRRIGIGVMRREKKYLYGGFKVVLWEKGQDD